MKTLTIQLLTIAIAVIVFSATDAVAQRSITLKDGKATVSATIEPSKGEVSPAQWSISGKQFSNLSIKQTNGGKFKYELRRGSEFLSSGHTTGSNIQVRSDGKSSYSITIINEENSARPIELVVVAGEEIFI